MTDLQPVVYWATITVTYSNNFILKLRLQKSQNLHVHDRFISCNITPEGHVGVGTAFCISRYLNKRLLLGQVHEFKPTADCQFVILDTSRVMQNLFLPSANNKDKDKPVHPRSLINPRSLIIIVICCLVFCLC